MFEEAYQSWARKVVHAREVAKSVALILSQMCDPQRHSGEGKAKSQTSEWEHQAERQDEYGQPRFPARILLNMTSSALEIR